MDAAAGEAARGGWLGRAADLRAGERPGARWAFAYHFALLCGYYLLRPLREEMGIRGDVSRLPALFTATFVVMLVAVPAWSALVARLPRSRAVPWVYRFFLLNLLAFFALFRAGAAPQLVANAFFVWVSVYNLLVVSVFWSFMADLFSAEQGKRLFGLVAAGGSAGALAGPALAALLVGRVGVAGLVLLSAALLEVSARCALRLVRWAQGAPRGGAAPAGGEEAPVGGSALAGFATVARAPYLRALAVQMLLQTTGATFLYFQQARIVAAAFPDPERRTALFAGVDLAVNVAALLLQSLATGRIVRALGLGTAMALVPALSIAGFAALARAPTVWALAAVQAVRRAGHYALERPAQQVLYTVVSREARYKAKSFIDTAVYRFGDVVAGWLQAALVGLGLGLPGLCLAAIPVSGASVAVALWLGRRERALEGQASGPAAAPGGGA